MSSSDDITPLSWLLRVVPPSDNLLITYSDIPTLSAYENQTIPTRQASMREKMNWWNTFAGYVLGGVPFSGLPEVWGFDEVDFVGILAY
jgi:hypothetical protein